jgi:rhodanese-related sulfurtransferase
MKRLCILFGILPVSFLLTAFLWSEPTWDEIDRTLDRQYPMVENLDIDTLKASLDQGRAPVLIDVRSKEEFAVSHLANAINISKVEGIDAALDTPVVVYCSVGLRSAAFARELAAKGFTDVKNLRGSIFAWANRGYPLWRDATPVRTVHPYDKKWGVLLNEELHYRN